MCAAFLLPLTVKSPPGHHRSNQHEPPNGCSGHLAAGGLHHDTEAFARRNQPQRQYYHCASQSAAQSALSASSIPLKSARAALPCVAPSHTPNLSVSGKLLCRSLALSQTPCPFARELPPHQPVQMRPPLKDHPTGQPRKSRPNGTRHGLIDGTRLQKAATGQNAPICTTFHRKARAFLRGPGQHHVAAICTQHQFSGKSLDLLANLGHGTLRQRCTWNPVHIES